MIQKLNYAIYGKEKRETDSHLNSPFHNFVQRAGSRDRITWVKFP